MGTQSNSVVVLIPWNPDCPAHVKRLHQQRVACGWKADYVESWRDLQRQGKIGLHWIVLTPSHPDTDIRLQQHIQAYPEEATPLEDTCKLMLSRTHSTTPGMEVFLPIGHISLDASTTVPELQTSTTDGVYSLTSFYVSKALQNGGLGVAALGHLEKMAAVEFNAKAITLCTISNEEMFIDNPRRIATGNNTIPKVTNEDWYARRGYHIYLRSPAAWHETDSTGKRWPVKGIYMIKKLTAARA